MARGALQFPYTSGPEPEKSKTALPCGESGDEGWPRIPSREGSPKPHLGGGGMSHVLGPPAHLLGIHLHPQPDGRTVIHAILGFHRGAPMRGETLQHLPHGHLGVGLGTAGVTAGPGGPGGPGGPAGPTWMWAMYAWTTGRPWKRMSSVTSWIPFWLAATWARRSDRLSCRFRVPLQPGTRPGAIRASVTAAGDE